MIGCGRDGAVGQRRFAAAPVFVVRILRQQRAIRGALAHLAQLSLFGIIIPKLLKSASLVPPEQPKTFFAAAQVVGVPLCHLAGVLLPHQPPGGIIGIPRAQRLGPAALRVGAFTPQNPAIRRICGGLGILHRAGAGALHTGALAGQAIQRIPAKAGAHPGAAGLRQQAAGGVVFARFGAAQRIRRRQQIAEPVVGVAAGVRGRAVAAGAHLYPSADAVVPIAHPRPLRAGKVAVLQLLHNAAARIVLRAAAAPAVAAAHPAAGAPARGIVGKQLLCGVAAAQLNAFAQAAAQRIPGVAGDGSHIIGLGGQLAQRVVGFAGGAGLALHGAGGLHQPPGPVKALVHACALNIRDDGAVIQLVILIQGAADACGHLLDGAARRVGIRHGLQVGRVGACAEYGFLRAVHAAHPGIRVTVQVGIDKSLAVQLAAVRGKNALFQHTVEAVVGIAHGAAGRACGVALQHRFGSAAAVHIVFILHGGAVGAVFRWLAFRLAGQVCL